MTNRIILDKNCLVYPHWNNTPNGMLTRFKQICDAQIQGKKLLIDITINPGLWTDKKEFYRIDRWTTETKDQIISRGYRKCVGLHDNLAWIGIRVYIKINNGSEFDTTVKDPHGRFVYSQDTAITLNDAFLSDADDRFIRGMGRARAMLQMDLQTLAMMGIIGIGAVVGMYFLGVF